MAVVADENDGLDKGRSLRDLRDQAAYRPRSQEYSDMSRYALEQTLGGLLYLHRMSAGTFTYQENKPTHQ